MNAALHSARGIIRTHDPVILVVDDEPAVLHAVRRCLRCEPYEVITAQSCDEALAWVGELPVDLVIADQLMPRMKGTELVLEIRKRFPRTLGLLLTGDRSRLVAQECAAAGIDCILYKGGNMAALRSMLQELLAGKLRFRDGSGASLG